MSDAFDHEHPDSTLARPLSREELKAALGRSAPYILEQIDGLGAPRNFTLTSDRILIGRADHCDIRIASQRLSREHALLKRTGKEFRCEEAGSSHGLYLNSVQIHSASLRDGDTLQLADIVFVYHEGR